MRAHILRFILLIASVINAVPALGQLHPWVQEPVNDELMGSGRESGKALPSSRGARRIGNRAPEGEADGAIAAEIRLLLVEDNERLAILLQQALGPAGFDVDVLGTAGEAKIALREDRFDLVVLDLGLPDEDGISVLADMRARGDSTPLLILSARNALRDRAAGLQSGADDYLAKPFALDELIGRLQSLAQRSKDPTPAQLRLGNLALHRADREVYVNEQPIFIPPREIDALEILLQHSGRLVPKHTIEAELYGPAGESGPNAVEAIVFRLRNRLAESGATVKVQTFRGLGYAIAEEISTG